MNKTEKINIYINNKTKTKLLKFCAIHHVSFSTVIDKLCLCFYTTNEKLYINAKLDYMTKGNKTSVKVKSETPLLINCTTNEKAKLYTNIIALYFNKHLKKWFDSKKYENYQNKFMKWIDQETENYWNYNNHIRNEARMLKNKNTRLYLKKKLEQYGEI